MSIRARERGFTIIELMIAITLALISIAAVGSIFMAGSNSYRQDDKLSKMQENLRFAMAQISQDVEMAGYFAQIQKPGTNVSFDLTAAISGTDCGPTAPAFSNLSPIETKSAATATQANAAFNCIQASEFVDGTDIVAIKRALGGSFVPTAADNGKMVMRTDGVRGTVFKWGSADPQPQGTAGAVLGCTGAGTPLPQCTGAATVDVYEYRPVVWFVRKYAVAAGPAVPSLCRKYLQGAAWQTECLAEGIENLHVEFGVDANNDGAPDYFDPDPASLAQVIAMRISLLGRSSDPDVHYTNPKTYYLGGLAITPNDRYYRRELTSQVVLRNPLYAARPSGA